MVSASATNFMRAQYYAQTKSVCEREGLEERFSTPRRGMGDSACFISRAL